jgi:hypothetical protein
MKYVGDLVDSEVEIILSTGIKVIGTMDSYHEGQLVLMDDEKDYTIFNWAHVVAIHLAPENEPRPKRR